jgi:hypothetical protein
MTGGVSTSYDHRDSLSVPQMDKGPNTCVCIWFGIQIYILIISDIITQCNYCHPTLTHVRSSSSRIVTSIGGAWEWGTWRIATWSSFL